MKAYTVLLMTIFLLGTKAVIGQNYLNYYCSINKAEIAHLDKEFLQADSIYQSAFAMVEKPFKDDYLLAAINSEKLNDSKTTYEYLKNGVSVGLSIKRVKKQLSEFKQSDLWDRLKEEYESIHEKYLESLNLELREELLEMVDKDQAARHPIFGSAKKMKRIDTRNHLRLLEIIKKNKGKWPGRFTIGDGNTGGKYAYGEVTIMLHHFSKEQVNELKPILVDAIVSGDLLPYNVAYPLDYKNIKTIGERRRGKTILYDMCLPIGSYVRTGGKTVVICDCEKAEEERKIMGLEPLDDYYRKRNVNYECHKEK